MCREHKSLPSSYIITGELKIGDLPSGGGGYAKVWYGVYQGSKVAIKVLHVSTVDLASVEKVPFSIRLFFVLQYGNIPRTNNNGSGFLSRGGVMEAIQSPKRVSIDGRKQIFEYLHDGCRMDGTRYDHGLRHCMPWNQSTEAGKHPPSNLD